MGLVCVDHPHEHVNKSAAFCQRQHLEDAILRGKRFWKVPIVEALAGRCQPKLASASIRAVHRSFDQRQLLEVIDHSADARAIERHSLGQRVLVDTGALVKVYQHAKFQGP
jgi:hypothetical protein